VTDLERVRYQGGRMHGAILEMSGVLATRIGSMELVITDGGRVIDRARGGVHMPTIRVVQGPQPRTLPEVTTAPRRRRSTGRKSGGYD
jgi:hypothetical protein